MVWLQPDLDSSGMSCHVLTVQKRQQKSASKFNIIYRKLHIIQNGYLKGIINRITRVPQRIFSWSTFSPYFIKEDTYKSFRTLAIRL